MNPAEVQGMARIVVAGIKILRSKGEAFPGHGMTAESIVSRFNTKYETEYRTKDFWMVVQHIRADMGLPLGSDDTGYFWCITEAEWGETAARLRERIKTQQRAIDRPTLSFANSRQMEILAGAVKEQFNAEQVVA